MSKKAACIITVRNLGFAKDYFFAQESSLGAIFSQKVWEHASCLSLLILLLKNKQQTTQHRTTLMRRVSWAQRDLNRCRSNSRQMQKKKSEELPGRAVATPHLTPATRWKAPWPARGTASSPGGMSAAASWPCSSFPLCLIPCLGAPPLHLARLQSPIAAKLLFYTSLEWTWGSSTSLPCSYYFIPVSISETCRCYWPRIWAGCVFNFSEIFAWAAGFLSAPLGRGGSFSHFSILLWSIEVSLKGQERGSDILMLRLTRLKSYWYQYSYSWLLPPGSLISVPLPPSMINNNELLHFLAIYFMSHSHRKTYTHPYIHIHTHTHTIYQLTSGKKKYVIDSEDTCRLWPSALLAFKKLAMIDIVIALLD